MDEVMVDMVSKNFSHIDFDHPNEDCTGEFFLKKIDNNFFDEIR